MAQKKGNKKMLKKTAVFGLAVVFVALCLFPMAGPVMADETPEESGTVVKDLTQEITVLHGTSNEAFGGGEYYLIRFGTEDGVDSVFGIAWGTEEHPNTIHVISIQTRYLGMTQVVYPDGHVERHMVKTFTFYGVGLGNLFEFNDTNEDGVFNYTIQNPEDETTIQPSETLYNKMVPLMGVWNLKEINTTMNTGTGEKEWTITLYRENLSYKPIWPLQPIDDAAVGNVLERVEFTFHLKARMEEVQGVKIPQVEITLENGPAGPAHENAPINMYRIKNVERGPPVNVSGNRTVYSVKWDHLIEGWDFNQTNQHPALLLGTRNIVGRYAPANAPPWVQKFMERMHERERARIETTGGEEIDINDTNTGPSYPRPVRNRVEIEGNWTRVARFHWVSNVIVDGQEKTMHAQVSRGYPVTMIGRQGRTFSGFAFRIGFTYPGGETISHDPAIEGTSYLDLQESSEQTNNTPPGLRQETIVLLGILVIGVVVIALVAANRKKGRPETYSPHYDTLHYQPPQSEVYSEERRQR